VTRHRIRAVDDAAVVVEHGGLDCDLAASDRVRSSHDGGS
jgi:hypothetical protein